MVMVLILHQSYWVMQTFFSWHKADISRSATNCFEIPPKVVTLAFERISLSLRHANDYSSKRVVLIGDTTHTVHLLAGQGVNLGFGDASTLSSVISEGIVVGTDIGEVCIELTILIRCEESGLFGNHKFLIIFCFLSRKE